MRSRVRRPRCERMVATRLRVPLNAIPCATSCFPPPRPPWYNGPFGEQAAGLSVQFRCSMLTSLQGARSPPFFATSTTSNPSGDAAPTERDNGDEWRTSSYHLRGSAQRTCRTCGGGRWQRCDALRRQAWQLEWLPIDRDPRLPVAMWWISITLRWFRHGRGGQSGRGSLQLIE
jgi:hypothetical protein